MKKLIAALAVVVFAVAAQAELLAEWKAVGGAVDADTMSKTHGFAAGDLELYGNAKQTSTTSIFGVNTLTDGASGISFDVVCDDGFAIMNAQLAAQYTGSPTGPKQIDFLVNDVVRTTHSRPGQGSDFDVTLGYLGDAATVAIVANKDAGTVRSGTGETFNNNGGTFVIRTGMTLNGDVVVPEPATMSLLGLGALAMVIRRKLRK